MTSKSTDAEPTFNVPPVPGLEDLDEAGIQRIFGRWEPMQPRQVLDLFLDAPFRWWIAGGWAIEAASGQARNHWDTDVAILLRDLDVVRKWLRDFHLWEVQEGNLRPLVPGDRLTPDREQLWMRKDALSPWVLDLLLSPDEDDQWLYKRDHSVRRPLDEVGHSADGISYLRPSIVLLFKSRRHRPKDDRDLDSIVPHLDHDELMWLASAIRKSQPSHPWLSQLDQRAD